MATTEKKKEKNYNQFSWKRFLKISDFYPLYLYWNSKEAIIIILLVILFYPQSVSAFYDISRYAIYFAINQGKFAYLVNNAFFASLIPY